jgi:hypothetical protein
MFYNEHAQLCLVLLRQMVHPERIYFEKLKQEIAVLFRQTHTDAPERMEDWSGKILERFQAALLGKVKSSVSTKWYYTHIKGGNEQKLPRVDVLNLLSEFAGYESWEVFVVKKKEEGLIRKVETEKAESGKEEKEIIPGEKEAETESSTQKNDRKSQTTGSSRRMLTFLLSTVAVIVLIVLLMMFTNVKNTNYHFCFADADLGSPLKNEKISINVIREGESPMVIKCDSMGCFTLQRSPGKVTFIVHADYYRPDTVTRLLTNEPVEEMIPLHSDDYARMIRIFSSSKVEDYEKRRAQLDKMFASDAEIIQVDPGDNRGMEMFNKEEFINKLTMPISSLKNIEVIGTDYDPFGKIMHLRFIQKTEEK